MNHFTRVIALICQQGCSLCCFIIVDFILFAISDASYEKVDNPCGFNWCILNPATASMKTRNNNPNNDYKVWQRRRFKLFVCFYIRQNRSVILELISVILL